MTESYIIPEFDENGNFLSDDVKARIVEMIESHIIPEFDENGNILRDDVKARIVEMIEAHAPTPVPSNPGPEVITLEEGHPKLAGTLAEPLPDDLPVGSYLINEPRFMGYRLSQKTPLGWDIKDFEATINYQIPSLPSFPLRAWVMRGSTPIEGVGLVGSATSTADSLHVKLELSNTNFIKGKVVKVVLEGPSYNLAKRLAVSHEYSIGANGPEASSHLLNIGHGTPYVEGENVPGIAIDIIVGRDTNRLKIDTTFDLTNPPDMRVTDGLYAPPSARVEVEVPEPTVVAADDHMSSTVTIPEVEGVTWSFSSYTAWSGNGVAEPGVYEVPMAEVQSFAVVATAKKGYYIKNNDGFHQVPWKTRVSWSYKQGLPLTVPKPEVLNATTEGGVNGWMVRYPEVEHVRYYYTTGWGSSMTKTVLTGDAFTPVNKSISAEADLPYYVTNASLGYLKADGTIS